MKSARDYAINKTRKSRTTSSTTKKVSKIFVLSKSKHCSELIELTKLYKGVKNAPWYEIPSFNPIRLPHEINTLFKLLKELKINTVYGISLKDAISHLKEISTLDEPTVLKNPAAETALRKLVKFNFSQRAGARYIAQSLQKVNVPVPENVALLASLLTSAKPYTESTSLSIYGKLVDPNKLAKALLKKPIKELDPEIKQYIREARNELSKMLNPPRE